MRAEGPALRYSLSFAVATLLSTEASLLAPLYLECGDWTEVRRRAIDENLLKMGTRNSSARMTGETIRRLQVLHRPELELLPELFADERHHLMWVAACRENALIGEFADEVLRERFLTLMATVTYEDYDVFFRAKAAWQPELLQAVPAVLTKARRRLFRMMMEAGFLTEDFQIEPALLSPRLTSCLQQTSPEDVRFFPVRSL